MAESYLQFSETLGPLTRKQEAWLKRQLEPIVVVNGTESPADEEPDGEPDYRGLRFLRDYDDLDDDANSRGFGVDFQGSGKDRHAWIYAEESGNPGRVVHLVQKFLTQFHPDQCWSLSYANTCSKPRAGEFGGGAAFVTADGIRWNDCYDFIEEQRKAFERRQQQDLRLIRKARELGIDPVQLDEEVHEAAAATAASINNAGVEDQITFLIDQFGPEATEKILDEPPDAEETEDGDDYDTDDS